MEIYERIRYLRKNHLHLSQTAFGEKLGVSRSVINNIESNVLARPEQKLSLIKLICKEFSVSEDWILNGAEPMIIEPDTFNLDDFVKQHNGTELELEIMKAYFELEPDVRQKLIQHFSSVFVKNKDESEKLSPTEIAKAEYIKSRSKLVKKQENNTNPTNEKSLEELSDEEQIELYRQELKHEREVKEKSEALRKSG